MTNEEAASVDGLAFFLGLSRSRATKIVRRVNRNRAIFDRTSLKSAAAQIAFAEKIVRQRIKYYTEIENSEELAILALPLSLTSVCLLIKLACSTERAVVIMQTDLSERYLQTLEAFSRDNVYFRIAGEMANKERLSKTIGYGQKNKPLLVTFPDHYSGGPQTSLRTEYSPKHVAFRFWNHFMCSGIMLRYSVFARSKRDASGKLNWLNIHGRRRWEKNISVGIYWNG